MLQFLLTAQDYNARLVSQKTDIIIKYNKLQKTCFYEIKINNRRGEKYSKILIPYSKGDKISNIDAFIKDKNQVVVKKLKKSEVSDRSYISDFSFYEDDFVKEFTLKYNDYPYTIVYSYQITQNEFLFIDHWVPVLSTGIPTDSAKLTVTIPAYYKILHSEHLVQPPDTDTINEFIKYTWKTSYHDVVKSEIFSPPEQNFLPSVKIVPYEFKYDSKGFNNNWINFGNWQAALLQGLDQLTENEKIKINALTSGINDDTEKIKILYHYLQDETRYINISIETGGLKPYSAAYVSDNKYGDCKALTNYFRSVLDFTGIKAYYTLVSAGSPIKKIDKSFPSQQFNHVILLIPTASDTLWLDCTGDYAFNYLGTFTQNRDALVIEKDNSHFVHTPALSGPDVLVTRKIEIFYIPGAGSVVLLNNTYRGELYEQLTDFKNSFNKSELTKVLSKYFIEKGFELTNYKILNDNRDSLKIELFYKAETNKLFKKYGNELILKNIPFGLPQFEKPAKRKLPVQIDYPVFKIDTLVYEIPVGYKLEKCPDKQSFSNRFGEYSLQFFNQNSTITVVKKLFIKSGYYPLAEYKDFYDFINEINNFEHKSYLTLSR